MASNKKLLTSVAALGTAAALLLGGTFAWQSVSQTALNERSESVNPGGRLHNDIVDVEGVAGTYTNYIYVENFSEESDGQDIYARVRLEEYMELVMNYDSSAEQVINIAGKKTPVEGSTYTAENSTHQNEFEYTYALHFFGEPMEDEAPYNTTDAYWNWALGNADGDEGGKTVKYMPTFNKNKDSLAADQNGIYKGTLGGIIEQGGQYESYVDYNAGTVAEKNANAIYDYDGNQTDELKGLSAAQLNDIVENGTSSASWRQTYGDSVILAQETHNVGTTTATRGVISMWDWLNLNSSMGMPGIGEVEEVPTDNYWVYDDDGWVYWSSPIKPGEATGPLLEGFSLKNEMNETWYYAINVEAQFITADDLGKADGTGFYDESGWYDPTGLDNAADYNGAGQAPSENALLLLASIGVTDTDVNTFNDVELTLGGESDPFATASIGDTVTLKTANDTAPANITAVLLTVDGLSRGVATVAEGGSSDNNIPLYEGTDYQYSNGKLTLMNSETLSKLKTEAEDEYSQPKSGGAIRITTDDGETCYIVVEPDGELVLRSGSGAAPADAQTCSVGGYSSVYITGEVTESVTVTTMDGVTLTKSEDDGETGDYGWNYSEADEYSSASARLQIYNEEYAGQILIVTCNGAKGLVFVEPAHTLTATLTGDLDNETGTFYFTATLDGKTLGRRDSVYVEYESSHLNGYNMPAMSGGESPRWDADKGQFAVTVYSEYQSPTFDEDGKLELTVKVSYSDYENEVYASADLGTVTFTKTTDTTDTTDATYEVTVPKAGEGATAVVSVKAGETVKLKYADGTSPAFTFSYPCAAEFKSYSSTSASKDTDFTYEDGVLTLMGDKLQPGIGFFVYENVTESATVAVIYEDDGKITFNNSYYDCTQAVVNEGVTVETDEGTAPDSITTANTSYVAGTHYKYENGTLTVLSDDLKGKILTIKYNDMVAMILVKND